MDSELCFELRWSTFNFQEVLNYMFFYQNVVFLKCVLKLFLNRH
jgi:hypothetical protein